MIMIAVRMHCNASEAGIPNLMFGLPGLSALPVGNRPQDQILCFHIQNLMTASMGVRGVAIAQSV